MAKVINKAPRAFFAGDRLQASPAFEGLDKAVEDLSKQAFTGLIRTLKGLVKALKSASKVINCLVSPSRS